MERLSLEVKLRDTRGKGAARRLRAGGAVPAVVYGAGQETVVLQVDEAHLASVLRQGTNQIIDLQGPDGFEGRLVLLKEFVRDPVSRAILHADFYAVDTKKRIEVDVPIRLEGKPHGVEMGGVLEMVLRVLHVRCLPLSIPESFNLDVSALDIGDALHVGDLVLPSDVELMVDTSVTVVHVTAPRVEETPEEEAAEEGAEAAAEPAEGEEAAAPKAEEAAKD